MFKYDEYENNILIKVLFKIKKFIEYVKWDYFCFLIVMYGVLKSSLSC